jgi:pyrroloquinoline quinone biosynthesis protein D
MNALSGNSRPRLAPGVRLRHDGVRNAWVLLAPESIIDANPVAVEVIRRLTGDVTLDGVIDDLAASFTTDRAVIEADVRSLLAKMIEKGLVEA